MTKYLSTREAAEYLGVSKTYLEHRRLSGGGPPYSKIDGGRTSLVRYAKEDLDVWMASPKVTSTSCPVSSSIWFQSSR